ncbi:MAG: hypothetical protein MZV63_55250 [Marinilabiliales bacterium]|nr:hypothetical protein [Marinilabiliales bacterium]
MTGGIFNEALWGVLRMKIISLFRKPRRVKGVTGQQPNSNNMNHILIRNAVLINEEKKKRLTFLSPETR